MSTRGTHHYGQWSGVEMSAGVCSYVTFWTDLNQLNRPCGGEAWGMLLL